MMTPWTTSLSLPLATVVWMLVMTLILPSAVAFEAPDIEEPANKRAASAFKQFMKTMQQVEEKEHGREGKLERAAKHLDRIEQYDDAYDTKPLRDYHAAVSSKVEAEAAEKAALEKLEREYRKLIALISSARIDDSWSSKQDNARIEGEIAALRALVERARSSEFHAISPAKRGEVLSSYERNLTALERGVDKDLDFIRMLLKEGRTKPDAAFNSILAMEATWEAGATLLSENAAIVAAHGRVLALKKEVGSRVGARGTMEASKQAKARARQIPEAKFQDAAASALFTRAFKAQDWGETLLVVNITTDWYIERDPVSERIQGRSRSAWLVGKKADGSCQLYDFTIFQAHDGGGFADANTRRKSHTAYPIACENVKK